MYISTGQPNASYQHAFKDELAIVDPNIQPEQANQISMAWAKRSLRPG